MADLRSAALPDLQDDDHVRGAADAQLLIEYGDLECPHCAVLHARLKPLFEANALRWVYRHFPLRSAHPRAWPAACASEAAALQGRFWEMHDSLLEDQGRLEDPHLWERARVLGLDVEQFDADRRSDALTARVKRDFVGAVRAGVVTTPSVFAGGVLHQGDALEELVQQLQRA